MIRTLIVDDETLVRVTLRSLLDWESFGYTIVGDCIGGMQALDYLKDHTVDLLITDIKMPGLSGLALLERLRAGSHVPVSVVLSSYNEFELVREAFRLGAYDYLLKADLNADMLARMLKKLRSDIFKDEVYRRDSRAHTAGEMPAPEPGEYAAVVFSVEDMYAQNERFGVEIRERMEKPMLELVRQIPRVNTRAVIQAVTPGYYRMRYQVRDRSRFFQTIPSVVRQIQSVWRDYMNLSVSVAVSDVVPDTGLDAAFALCDSMIQLSVLKGRGALCSQWQYGQLAKVCDERAGVCDTLLRAACGEDDQAFESAVNEFLQSAMTEQNTDLYLVLLARIGHFLRAEGSEFWEVLPEEDYTRTVQMLETPSAREQWLRSTLRQLRGHLHQSSQQSDAIQRARQFLQDNYTNPAITLKTVADYVGYNEKYFSSRFTKKCGYTFIAYLNQLRLERARELLLQTDWRMYEISEYVGYNSVEHFNHTFKKKFGISPSDYRNGQKTPN